MPVVPFVPTVPPPIPTPAPPVDEVTTVEYDPFDFGQKEAGEVVQDVDNAIDAGLDGNYPLVYNKSKIVYTRWDNLHIYVLNHLDYCDLLTLGISFTYFCLPDFQKTSN